MILVCPECKTRYLVEANLFAMGARQVRCARCKHNWKAELPNEIDVVAPPPLEPDPIPEAITPIPEGSNLPIPTEKPKKPFVFNLDKWSKKQRIAFAGIAVSIVLTLVVGRQFIVNRWPVMEKLYTPLGLYVYHPGDELEFQQVRSELKYDGGITKLVLNGKIKNKTKKSQTVPPIVAQAVGADGAVMQSWQIEAPTATLSSEGEAGFTSSINAPQGTVVNVQLNFAEGKE